MTVLDRSLKRPSLGRGLGALIPQGGASTGVLRLPIERILRDGRQPRKAFDPTQLQELAESIKAQGLLQPVLVRRTGDRYLLIAGERRWRAAQLAGLHEIPAVVREASDAEAFELALVENLQRSDLNPLEEADGYRRLVDEFGLTQEQVSARVGKERSSVSNALRLLGLPEEVKQMLASGALQMGHARALLGLPTAGDRRALAQRVAAQGLSVRDTERLVKGRRTAPAVRNAGGRPAPGAGQRAVVEELQRRFGTKVRLVDRGGAGTLELDFFSYEDLERILALLRR